MRANQMFLVLLLASPLAPVGPAVAADDVVRGLDNGAVPPGMAGKKVAGGVQCEFKPTDANGYLDNSSVNCGGPTDTIVRTLEPYLTAYCTIPAANLKGATVKPDPVKGNKWHCLLNGIKPKDAQQQFKGAIWR